MKNKIKKLFSTPTRAVISTLVIVLIVSVIGAGAAVAAIAWDRHEDRIEYAIEEKLYGSQDADVPVDEATTGDSQSTDAVQGQTDKAAGDSQGAADQAAGSQSGADAHQKITATQAEDIALKNAGLARKDVTDIYSHYEMDDGFYQYEIQFFKGETEYEYTVNAETGAIMERDQDYIYD